jgi:hypothetical protein
MNSLLMTRADFARHRGVQKSAVSNWSGKGWLVFAEGPGGKQMIDVARTEAKLNANLDPSRGRPTTGQMQAAEVPLPSPGKPAAPANDGGLSNVRTDLIRSQTVGKNLDNARRAGELVPFQEFERLATEAGRVTRERMIALARTNAERLAAERDPRQIVAILTEGIDQTFAELAEQLMKGEEGDDPAALEAIENAESAIVAEDGEETAASA